MSNAANNVAVVPEDSQNITREKLKKFLPKGSSIAVTDEVLEAIHNMENDTGLPQNLLEEDVMSYMHLLGKVKGVGMMNLVNAIKYCNLKRNHTNSKAWAIVFPKKYDELMAEGKKEAVDNFASMYNGSAMVVAIDKEMILPVYIQYAAHRHKMIDVQYRLAMGTDSNGNDASAMVQHLASKTLLEILTPPEDKTIQLKVGMSDATIAHQQEMNNTLAQLVANQSKMFAQGMHAAEVQKIHTVKIIDESEDAVVLNEDEDE